MTPAEIFKIANTVALVAWLALIIARFVPSLRRWVDPTAGYVVPALFAVAYIWLLGPGALDVLKNGSFNSLAGVGALFSQPGALLGGWIHYLAFDLWAGAWQARDAEKAGVPHWLVLPCLFLTLMAGPVGLGLYLIIRTGFRGRAMAAAA